MTLLEDWLTDIGDQIVRKKAADASTALGPREQIVYEVWLFDTEVRNGGVSQYFCNRGLERWGALLELAHTMALPRLVEFADKVNEVVAGTDDPYEAVLDADVNLDAVYEQCQHLIVAELRAFVESHDD